ncbi:VPS13 domain-containing protein, partial [Trichostrongylus colubriformis]
MERNSSKFPLKGPTPRFKFFLRPEKITVEMTRRQIAELRALNREWARFERARQHRKWRPLTHVGENAAAWWRFAYNRVSDDARRVQSRRSWHFALTRARHLNAYCRAYRRRLLAMIDDPTTARSSMESNDTSKASPSKGSTPVPGSHEDIAIMKQIERDSQYTYHELHLFRETVFRRILREKSKVKGIEPSPAYEDTFETIDSPVEEIPSSHILDAAQKEESRGLYGWITSFFTQEENDVEKEKQEVFDFGKFDTHEFKDLPKSFNVKEMEEEILDVLHESWDDSTLLRRDVLLAEIAMRLEHLTLRFTDTVVLDKVEQKRVLAMDLTGVTSRVELSPRQHSLIVSLAVHDMSIQRLRTGHLPRKDGQSDDELDESFMFSLMESTKILLAVGRKDNIEDTSEPMFRMLYRRRSPRLTVRHNVEGSFRPVSVMYEENALNGLSSLFADDPNMFTSVSLLQSSDIMNAGSDPSSSEQIIAIESHVFVNFHIPSVTMELRRRGWDVKKRSPTEWEAGDPFACLTLQNVSIGYVAREAHVSKIKLGVGHLELADLMERTVYPLLSTRGTFGLSKTLSASCPDLSSSPSSQVTVSSSLPSRSCLE